MDHVGEHVDLDLVVRGQARPRLVEMLALVPHARLMAPRGRRVMMAVVRLLIAIVLCAGCSDIVDFDITQPVPEQRVQGSPLPGPLATLFPLPLDLDLSTKIREQDSGPIDSIMIASLVLTITDAARPSGDTDDWSFVESIHVFVKSSKQGSSLPRVEIANVGAPGAVTTLTFQVADVNIKPYVDEGSVVESEGRGTLPLDDVSYNGSAVFTVHPL
jgi:hypothetical protein